MPNGVKKFKSKLSKDTQYKFIIPGIYAYWCTPHKSMGMIGFIIVDNNLDNLKNIKKVKFFSKSKKLAKKSFGNKKLIAINKSTKMRFQHHIYEWPSSYIWSLTLWQGGKRIEVMKAILSIYAVMNQLDQSCYNFPVRIPLKITSGGLDGCKVKTMNLRLRSLL